MPKVQVLFIDDDNSLQLLASALLNSGDFEVIAVLRTAEAEKILANRHVDIIVCDVMMPDEDGLKFCRRIRDRGVKTPFLFLSAVSDPKTIKVGLDAGADDYFVKPFDIRELQKKIRSMLEKYKPGAKPASKEPPKSSGPLSWFRR